MGALVGSSCDLRSAFGPARNQGDRPTCLAFAMSDAHSAVRGDLKFMSPEHLYFHAVKRSAGCHPDDGVALQEACEALKQDGQSIEAGWPYLGAIPSNPALWVPPATAAPVFRRGTQMTTSKIPDLKGRL